ncbi:MAG: hypothetical protein U0359_27310 [Byssovorax sp.]
MSPLLPLALLFVLGLTDAAFAGFRDAAGRDARIFKAEYNRRGVRRGLRFGLAVSALSSLLAAAVVVSAPSPAARLAELSVSAWWMVAVLAVYATIVLIALGLWAIAEADLRTLASVTVLGPFTLLRPWVIAAAGAVGAWHAPSTPVVIVAIGASLFQLSIERWMGLGWRGGERPLG